MLKQAVFKLCISSCEGSFHKPSIDSCLLTSVSMLLPKGIKTRYKSSYLLLILSTMSGHDLTSLSLICMLPGFHFIKLSMSSWKELFLIWADRQQRCLFSCVFIFQWESKIWKQIYHNAWKHWIRKDSFRAMTCYFSPLMHTPPRYVKYTVLKLYKFWKLSQPLSFVVLIAGALFTFLCFVLFLLALSKKHLF